MAILLLKSCCFAVPLRAGCLAAGWYDIIYGHGMILVYLLALYTGYFNTNNECYQVALWLDFVFTVVQLFGGVLLVYAIRKSKPWPLLFYSRLGVTLMAVDAIGDALLWLSFPDATSPAKVVSAVFLAAFIAIRGYMSWCAFSYFKELKKMITMREKLLNTIPDIIRYST